MRGFSPIKTKNSEIMKTYKKIIEKPKLEIFRDDCSENPRKSMSNIGYFEVSDRNKISPDGEYLKVVEETSMNAKNVDDHMEKIAKELENMGEDVLLIVPISTYEHGRVSYSIGFKNGFDNSNNGFYIVTKDKASELISDFSEDNLKSIIKAELETYTKWVNGDVYGFNLYDDNGILEDSMVGFYGVEDIEAYLPEFEDENLFEYIV